jgi:hypothetical protein
VLENSKGSYVERVFVKPGEEWTTDQPFPFSLDTATLR